MNYENAVANWRYAFLFSILGAVAATALYFAALGGAEAIVVFQAGRVGGIENVQTKISHQLAVDRRAIPFALYERLQTKAFAQRLADALGDQTLVDNLPATQYGGKAQLRVRGLGDGTLGEIRVRSASRELALKIANLAANLAVAMDQETLLPLRELMKQRIATLQRERAATLKVADALSAALDSGDVHTLMTTFDARTRVQGLNDSIWALEAGQVPPLAQDPMIFSPAALTAPLIKTWWMAPVLGLLAGGALGFAAHLLQRKISSRNPAAATDVRTYDMPMAAQ